MNQMKKNYLGLPPLFCPAEILVTPEVEAAFADWEIACALWRHLHGDWAEPFAEHAAQWQTGRAMDCYYFYHSLSAQRERWLRVQTTADRHTTRLTAERPPDVNGDLCAADDEEEEGGWDKGDGEGQPF